MTKVVAHIISSKRDVNGNTYHFGLFYNPEHGRQERLAVHLGGESNGEHLAWQLAGEEWEQTLVFRSELPIREWNRQVKHAQPEAWLGTDTAKATMLKLWGKEGV